MIGGCGCCRKLPAHGLRPAVLPGMSCPANVRWALPGLHSSKHREHGMQVQRVRTEAGTQPHSSDNRGPSVRQWGHSPLAGDAGWGPGVLRHTPSFMLQACVIYVTATTLPVLFVLRSFSVFCILWRYFNDFLLFLTWTCCS